MREARVILDSMGRPSLETVKAYLPSNYQAASEADGSAIRITGFDDHGWTLDGYVIPRLASGLIAAREVIRVDVLCGCGWGRLAILEDTVPEWCPMCGCPIGDDDVSGDRFR